MAVCENDFLWMESSLRGAMSRLTASSSTTFSQATAALTKERTSWSSLDANEPVDPILGAVPRRREINGVSAAESNDEE
jgi:hypothetical protein